MEDLIKKSNVLVEINQGNIRKGRNTSLTKEIASTLPTASTGLSTFARAKNSSKKDSNFELNGTEQNESAERPEHVSLFTSGKSVFKSKPLNSFNGCNSVKKLKDLLVQERKCNQTPPIPSQLRTPLVRISSESKFYCNETFHGKQTTSCNSQDQRGKPSIFLDVPPSRENSKESKGRKIALIYENAAIRGIQKLNRKKLPEVKKELRQLKFRQTPELSNKSISSRSQSPSIQMLHPGNRNYKRIDYLRASIGNCERKNESFLSSISFKSPLKYRANQSIGGNQTYEKSTSRTNRLVIKKAQINSKRQKLINLYRGDQPRTRNQVVPQIESLCPSSKLKGKPLLQVYQDDDTKGRTPKQLNLDLPMTPRESAKRRQSITQSEITRKNESINDTKSMCQGDISSSQSESFSILKPALASFQNQSENSRNHFKRMSQFKKSGHSRHKALGQEDFKRISSSFMQPSSRSRALPDLGSKSTDVALRQRNLHKDSQALLIPRINLEEGPSQVNLSAYKLGEEMQDSNEVEGSDYEVGTFRIADNGPSVLKIRRHSNISEAPYEEEKESLARRSSNHSEQLQHNYHEQQQIGEQLQNLDTQDISIHAIRNEDEQQECSKNDPFYFQNSDSEKKNSDNNVWDADKLLDEAEEEAPPPHNLSSYMIMEMLKKNKEKQKRHKLIRNISNADTEEFRSHRSISQIFEAAEEEEDGFLCDESDAFVRRFNTTGAELSQAIEDMALSSNYLSSKV